MATTQWQVTLNEPPESAVQTLRSRAESGTLKNINPSTRVVSAEKPALIARPRGRTLNRYPAAAAAARSIRVISASGFSTSSTSRL
jgi:hypothetical protein